ncbi:MAG: hypothetical protein AAFZ65_04040 [Planctomycetota bacterium]
MSPPEEVRGSDRGEPILLSELADDVLGPEVWSENRLDVLIFNAKEMADRAFGRRPWLNTERRWPELIHGARLARLVLWMIPASVALVLLIGAATAPSLVRALDVPQARVDGAAAADGAQAFTGVDQEIFDTYAQARQDHTTQFIGLAKALVTALAPFFTLVAGYAFAKEKQSADGDEGSASSAD